MAAYSGKDLQALGAKPSFKLGGTNPGNLPSGGLRPISDITYSTPSGQTFSYTPVTDAAGFGGDAGGYFTQTGGTPAGGGSSQPFHTLVQGAKNLDPSIVERYNNGLLTSAEAEQMLRATPDYGGGQPQLVNGQPVPGGVTPNAGLGTGFSANGTEYGMDLPVDMSTMTKEQMATHLAAGSEPANYKAGQGTTVSSAAALKSKISSAATPPSTGDTSSSTATSSAPSTQPQGGQTSPVTGLPYPDLGSMPEFDAYQQTLIDQNAYGLPALQDQVMAIDSQIAALRESLVSEQEKIYSQPISTRVMAAEYKAKAMGVTKQIQELNANKAIVNNQISAANKAVSLIMSATKADYATAKAQWTKENNANLAYIKQFDAGTTPQQKLDKAYVQGIMKNLTPGQQLSGDQKMAFDEKVLSAYGPEFIGIEQSGIGAALYSTTVRAGGKNYIETLHANPDGSLELKYTAPANVGTPTPTEALDLSNYAESHLQDIVDPNTGFVDANKYGQMRQIWEQQGGKATTFDSQFSHFLDPNDPYVKTHGIKRSKPATPAISF